MEANIVEKTRDFMLVEWSDKSLGYGQLKMKWDPNVQRYILDTENLGIDTTIRIFQALEV